MMGRDFELFPVYFRGNESREANAPFIIRSDHLDQYRQFVCHSFTIRLAALTAYPDGSTRNKRGNEPGISLAVCAN